MISHQARSGLLGYRNYRGPKGTGVDMPATIDFERILVALRGGGDRLLVLVEDAAVDSGWRIVTEAQLVEIGQSLESSSREASSVPSRLGYNLSEAAEAVGVSQHKIQEWLRRAVDPLPYIKDGRRIIIPVDLLIEWLRDEAGRQMSRQR